MLRHFEQEEIAQRYANFRPKVHSDIIDTVAKVLNWSSKFEIAVDYACGTGHSTAPLLHYAHKVFGCDISVEMLKQARQQNLTIEFRQIQDGELPFTSSSVNLLTVGFAFHWLDQAAFLNETCRVLANSGLLIIYNMGFPGVMLGNDSYSDWHQNIYTARFPIPQRHQTPLSKLLEDGNYVLRIEKVIPLSIPQTLSALALRNYLTTQSNVSVTVEQGVSLQDIDTWLDEGIAPHFRKEKETFEYIGEITILRHFRMQQNQTWS